MLWGHEPRFYLGLVGDGCNCAFLGEGYECICGGCQLFTKWLIRIPLSRFVPLCPPVFLNTVAAAVVLYHCMPSTTRGSKAATVN